MSTPTRRLTRQRTAIEGDLERVEEFRSAQQIHASLHARGEKIGLATVYRTLQAMVEEDLVDALRTAAARAFTGGLLTVRMPIRPSVERSTASVMAFLP